MLEKIFTPYVTVKRHQFVLDNLSWQVCVLSNWAHYAFGENECMLLLGEQGVCGLLLAIHNATASVEEDERSIRADWRTSSSSAAKGLV